MIASECQRGPKTFAATSHREAANTLGARANFSGSHEFLRLSGKINTAFVELVNLTVQGGIAGRARQTWATAQIPEQLIAQAEVWRAYFHFMRVNKGLCVPLA